MKVPAMFRQHNMIMLFVCLFLSLILSGTTSFNSVQAKSKKACFKKKITTLTVGKRFRYQIKHLPKKAKISYSCNHKTIANIHKKKGILTAKKQGKVTIRAKIVSPNKRKTILKTSVRILGQKKIPSTSAPSKDTQNTVFANTSLTVSKQVNPWNHTFVLYSSRILLNEELKNTCLNLNRTDQNTSTENRNLQTITAKFHSLSDDGKKATYQIESNCAANLCPGNGTANGDYIISGSILSDRLSIHYEERLSPNQIRGFAFDTNENALANINVSLFIKPDDSESPHLQSITHTNQNGYYSFQSVPDNRYYLMFSKDGYFTATSESFYLKQSVQCQNITLKALYSNISCKITDSFASPLPNIPVSIRKKNSSLQWSGYSDKQGLISFTNTSSNNNTNYTDIRYCSAIHTPKYIHDAIPLPEKCSRILSDSFSPENEYTLTICPNLSDPLQYESVSFTFSPRESQTEQILFDITLESVPILQTSNLSIKWDRNKAEKTDGIPDESPLNTTALKVQFFQRDSCAVFSDVLPINPTSSHQDVTNIVNTAFKNAELHLQNGKYYIMMQPVDIAGCSTHTPFISTVTIQDGVLPSLSASFSSGTSTKILLTGNFSTRHDTLPCTLYESVASQWIPIATLQSTPFEVLTETCSKAYVTCYPLLQNHMYRLESADTEICFTGNITFTPKEDTALTLPSEVTVPSFQIACRLQNNVTSSTRPNTTEHFHSHAEILCNTQFFQAADYVKDCVYIYQQGNGALCSVVLTNNADRHFLSNENNIIAFYDKLQSGKSIKTSQAAYRFSHFYV